MRVLFWFCDKFAWTPTIKTLDDAPDSGPQRLENVVVAFVHVEPGDVQDGSSAETKLVKNAKWLARKWDVKKILLHSLVGVAEYSSGDLQVKEPDKCEKWEWFVWGKFPENLFPSLKNVLAQGFHIPN